MRDDVQTAMCEILKGIQSDMSVLKTDVAGLKTDMSDVKERLGRVVTELAVVKQLTLRQRRDSAAMLVMMRGTVGVFDERMKQVEEDVRLLLEAEG